MKIKIKCQREFFDENDFNELKKHIDNLHIEHFSDENVPMNNFDFDINNYIDLSNIIFFINNICVSGILYDIIKTYFLKIKDKIWHHITVNKITKKKHLFGIKVKQEKTSFYFKIDENITHESFLSILDFLDNQTYNSLFNDYMVDFDIQKNKWIAKSKSQLIRENMKK